MALALRALSLLALLLAADATAGEVVVGRGVSTTRTRTDWKGYFNSDMKRLTTNAETTTVFERSANEPVTVNGVRFDLASASPIRSTSVARSVARPEDPDFGAIEVTTTSVDARGEEVRTSFVLRDKNLMAPIVVGPMEGAMVRPPEREQTIEGKTFGMTSTTRTTDVLAILVASSFEDLLAGRDVREVTEPGTRIEKGTMRVLSAKGEPIGFYAGDVRRADVVQYVVPR